MRPMGAAPATTKPTRERPLAGRHAVVTGASRGIGAAVARELAQLGAELTVVARGEAALRQTADELGKAGAKVAEIAADVTDEKAVAELGRRVTGVSILVNNAGGAG